MAFKTQKKSFSVILWLLFFAAATTIGSFLILKETKPKTPKYTIAFTEEPLQEIDDSESDEQLLEGITIAENPFNIPNPTNPKIAVIINDLGLNENLTDFINKSVNENITLSFSPYSRNLQEMIMATHDLNKEAYLRLVTSYGDYSYEDNGPKALALENSSETDNKIITELLASVGNIDGIIIDGFIHPKKQQGMAEMLNIIKNNGLLLIDATDNDALNNIETDGINIIRADIIIGSDTPKDIFNIFLEATEIIAKEKGQAVVVINPKPIDIMLVAEWIEKLTKSENSKDFTFVPISSLVTRNEKTLP